MLFTDLSTTKRKALAKDIKDLIEPDKAQTTSLLKETELRRFLKSRGFIANLGDVVQLLKAFYCEKTVNRLISKIQKSVVWDTSLSRLTIQKLGELLYCNPRTNIFITPVLRELKAKINEDDITNATKFKYLYYSILSDTNSEYSTIVDYQGNSKYTDDAILQFARDNMYMIYTYDHALGLRAKSRQIPVSIFNKLNDTIVSKYSPVSSGKNLVLTQEIATNISLAEIIKLAHVLHANKFVLTCDFIEELERNKNTPLTREFINFFVYDENEDYTIFSLYEDCSKYNTLCQKHNAIVLTSNEDCAISLKQQHVPYHIILNPTIIKFLEEKGTQVTLSYQATNKTQEEAKKLVAEGESKTTPVLITSTASVRIPYYSPRYDSVRFKPANATHEKMWVLDDSNNEVKPDNPSSKSLNYKAIPGYFIIHGDNKLDGTYSLTVYKIILKGTFKTGQIIQNFTFTSETEVPKEFKHYAAVLKMST